MPCRPRGALTSLSLFPIVSQLDWDLYIDLHTAPHPRFIQDSRVTRHHSITIQSYNHLHHHLINSLIHIRIDYNHTTSSRYKLIYSGQFPKSKILFRLPALSTSTSCVANITHSTSGASAKKTLVTVSAPESAAAAVPVSVSRLCICIASATPMRLVGSSRRSRLAKKRLRRAADRRSPWMRRLPLGGGGISGISGGDFGLVN